MRIVFACIAVLLATLIFADGNPPVGTPSLFFILLGASLVEALAVRLPYYGTISFGLVIYAPLITTDQYGPSTALAVALIAITLRELLTFKTIKRALDEALLDLGPLIAACFVPRFLSPDDPKEWLWLAVGLAFITSRHFLIRLLKTGLKADESTMVQRVHGATSDIRWGVLGLSLVAIPLMQSVPLATLALLPAIYSLRKAGIHAYAYLDREDKKALRKTLAGAESQIADLSVSLESTASERDLLFDLSKNTVGCSSLLELTAIIEDKARSLQLGNKIGLLLRERSGWNFLHIAKGGPTSREVDPKKLHRGFLDCWENGRALSFPEPSRNFYFQILPGVGVLSIESRRSKTENDSQVISLFASQVSLACLSARRLEEIHKTLEKLASLNTYLKTHNEALVGLTRQLQRLSASSDLSEACSYLPETCQLLLGDALYSIVVEGPTGSIFSWEAHSTVPGEPEQHHRALGQEHRLIITARKPTDRSQQDREVVEIGIQCLQEIFGQLLLARSLSHALKQLRASEAKLIESAKLAAVGQLSAGLAHEINNPLGSIRLGIEITMRKEELSPFSVELLEKALIGVERAEAITGSLLTYSRAGEKGQSPISAWDVLFDACSFLKTSLNHQGVRLEVPERQEEAIIYANSQDIQQILTNLLLNAKDAAAGDKPGRVVVLAETTSTGHFQIEVHDSGDGIPPENLASIFDPFFTTKPVGQGTGLGLSVSREKAHTQGGELTAGPSSLLSGACFRLRLPLHQRNEKARPS